MLNIWCYTSMDLSQRALQTNGKLFPNFESVFEFSAENRKFSKEWRGVNINQIAMCHISMYSSQRALQINEKVFRIICWFVASPCFNPLISVFIAVFVSISVCCAVQLGTQPYWLFCQCMMAVGLFYCAHWQTYVSGKYCVAYLFAWLFF